MFQRLVNHNDDLRRLIEKGYAISLDAGYLIVRDIPYLDKDRCLHTGAIVSKFDDIDGKRIVQSDHQIYFAGSVPHGLDGRPIPNLGGGAVQLSLGSASADVIVQRSFSNKPRRNGKFADHYEKIESYVAIISGPAVDLHGANPLTFRLIGESKEQSVFKFQDTLTSRAEITDLAQKFANDVVAVVGLGGTGSYLLDLLVKTPVREIRAFDLDQFRVHNAFRAPGMLQEDDLGKTKAEVYSSRYENFRHGLTVKSQFVDESCTADFDGVTFAFVCVDKGIARAGIFELLISKGIPFIDVGMGLRRKNNPLGGMLRCTYYPSEIASKVRDTGWAELKGDSGDLYRTNIQIAELNALNACLAVLRFKQIRGFYSEEMPYLHLLFDLGDLKTVGESELP